MTILVEKTIYIYIYVVVQFHPWLKFYFPLFLGMVIYDNEFITKENKINTNGNVEPQHLCIVAELHEKRF